MQQQMTSVAKTMESMMRASMQEMVRFSFPLFAHLLVSQTFRSVVQCVVDTEFIVLNHRQVMMQVASFSSE